MNDYIFYVNKSDSNDSKNILQQKQTLSVVLNCSSEDLIFLVGGKTLLVGNVCHTMAA